MRVSLVIEKLIIGGQGLARLADGKVVLVSGVLPGEEVVVELAAGAKKSFLEARLLEVVKPASFRVTPPCPSFDHCGGCDFQHVDPAHQATCKHDMLSEQLQRSSLISASSTFLEPPLPSPESFYYRQRIRLHLDANGRPGFRRRHSHQVEPVDCCLLARPELNDVLAFLVASPYLRKTAGLTQELELLLSPAEGKVVVLFHLARKPRPAEKKIFSEICAAHELIKGVTLFAAGHGRVDSFSRKEGEDPLLLYFSHTVGARSLRMSVEPGGFSQVNPHQNENLIDFMLGWAGTTGDERVLDLFCGMGNFSLPLALQAGEVVGMDLQRSAIRSAMQNAERNGLTNCSFRQGSSLEGARQWAETGEGFELVLLDPPRQGCAEVIPLLPKLAAQRIIYISCDPATLCRDLLLLEKEGYAIEKMRMVDMFPQTHHLETIVSLRLLSA